MSGFGTSPGFLEGADRPVAGSGQRPSATTQPQCEHRQRHPKNPPRFRKNGLLWRVLPGSKEQTSGIRMAKLASCVNLARSASSQLSKVPFALLVEVVPGA